MLTPEAQATLQRRASRGTRLIEAAWAPITVSEDDFDTAAKDAISDILTALFGPAGQWRLGRGLEPNVFALNEARRLVEEALRSYEGDAEDYTVEPEPGQYGYEES